MTKRELKQAATKMCCKIYMTHFTMDNQFHQLVIVNPKFPTMLDGNTGFEPLWTWGEDLLKTLAYKCIIEDQADLYHEVVNAIENAKETDVIYVAFNRDFVTLKTFSSIEEIEEYENEIINKR